MTAPCGDDLSNVRGPPGVIRAAPAVSGRAFYLTTGGRKGSGTRRPTFLAKRRETTAGGVAPGRGVWPRTLADRGAGTAFLAEHGGPSTPAAQHRPRAEAPQLDLASQTPPQRGTPVVP